MKRQISLLTSDQHGFYLGVLIDINEIADLIIKMKSLLGYKLSLTYIQNQLKRDNGTHHITLINPFEYLELQDHQKQKLVGHEIEYKILGLGKAINKNGSSFFAVVESPSMTSARKFLCLDSRDFHITLGFMSEDLHDVDKSRNSIIFS